MLTQYIAAAMKKARYEILAEVLEEWVLFRIVRGLRLPEGL